MSSDLDLWKGLAIAINVVVCFIGILLSRWISQTKLYEISCALVAGVLLATGLVHLLSDSVESLANLTELMNGYPFPYMLCGIMFIILLMIEQSVDVYQVKRKEESPKLFKGDASHTHPHDIESQSSQISTSSQLTSADDDASKDMHHHDVNMSEASAIFIFLALSVHSIFEGLSLGASNNASQIASTLIAIAIHKGLAAYALGASFIEAKVSKWRMVIFSVIFAFMTPAGIAIGWGLEAAESDTEVLSGVCSALAAGTFLYVGALEFVPMSFKPGSSYIIWKFVALLVGYGAMSALAIWT
ncbi:zinc transport protein, putative [Perkinsus marinus ATCC 50983]|uniref:Zinc transport protein, putative n=1 Tax=Perkinsus marinus (strain ATCC 50983 / TXsc) TaxID=423536 RepID=C5L3K2_PERM5|nr:zinc transport protein, putative [Perkinsus marinus ATCC 50983]EER08580.1 zinc transport protein, putative [Perkinsus marinus ATCC 50983]|eukprot:XP_002776764.1 zinc transport protein, putative [Perkinsus marinus ATCC 50983]